MGFSINELFNSWINWPDSWDIELDDEEYSMDDACKPRCVDWKCQSPIRARRAHQRVGYAVRSGKLPNLKYEVVKCSDCNRRATEYEHRDYSRPLDVVPICRTCNRKRGPARFARVFKVQATQVSKIDDRVSEMLLLINRKPSKNLVSRIEYELRKKK